jgi:hypothetical protein
VIWVAIVALACLIEWRRKRRLRRAEQAVPAKRRSTGRITTAGPDWDQDEPYPECFEED